MANSTTPQREHSADITEDGPSSPTDSILRNRRAPPSWADFSNTSPTSTISSTPTRMPLRHVPPTSTIGTPNKRVVLRADPTIISCFDISDKELYDLWAPKR